MVMKIPQDFLFELDRQVLGGIKSRWESLRGLRKSHMDQESFENLCIKLRPLIQKKKQKKKKK